MGFGDFAVESRVAVLEGVGLEGEGGIVVGDDYGTFFSSFCEVEVGEEDCFAGFGGMGESLAAAVVDGGLASEGESVLVSDAVAGGEEDFVFHGAGGGHQCRGGARADGPVGGEEHEFGAFESEDTGGFGRTEVVADEDSEASEGGLEDGEGVSGLGETVEPEAGKVGFDVPPHSAIRFVEDGGVEEAEGVFGGEAEDDVEVEFDGEGLDVEEGLVGFGDVEVSGGRVAMAFEGDLSGVLGGGDAVSG